jgi:hypothetical protein
MKRAIIILTSKPSMESFKDVLRLPHQELSRTSSTDSSVAQILAKNQNNVISMVITIY